MTQTNYNREVADTICSRMTEGWSLRSICRDEGTPSEGTVRGWAVRDHDGFCERYRAARLLLLEAWADQIVDITDEAGLDPQDRQVRVHTRQWLMSKLAPRRYGERLLHAGDPDNPLLGQLTDDQLATLDRFTTALVEETRE
jgi:hypothetical protein